MQHYWSAAHVQNKVGVGAVRPGPWLGRGQALHQGCTGRVSYTYTTQVGAQGGGDNTCTPTPTPTTNCGRQGDEHQLVPLSTLPGILIYKRTQQHTCGTLYTSTQAHKHTSTRAHKHTCTVHLEAPPIRVGEWGRVRGLPPMHPQQHTAAHWGVHRHTRTHTHAHTRTHAHTHTCTVHLGAPPTRVGEWAGLGSLPPPQDARCNTVVLS